ncbi:leishmanolysin-related zinc metalloendopeptidase [Marivita sp. S0852]|uniref:leishmanolysin-related zinc metalloendopeptidase n=1 Tax=Marivita sp. S0852 TaxID=3373893 RepID=UPI0039820075
MGFSEAYDINFACVDYWNILKDECVWSINMSNIFLTANDTFTQSSTNTNDTISGRAGGSETVILQGNPIGTTLDGNIETIQVAGTAANTTLQINAVTGQLNLTSGGSVYATFSGGLNQAIDLQFTDGNVTLNQTGANSFTIANPTNAASIATITATTPQAGSAVTLGTSISNAGNTGGTGGSGPTYALSPNAITVDEGATTTFTLNTTNVAAGTDLAYTITGVSAADITGPLAGTATVGAGGTASIAVQIAADQLTEGPETLTLSLDNGAASANVTVLDTSVAPGNIYISGQGGNGVVSNFNIEVVFDGVFTAGQRTAFEVAADYLSALIPGDVPDRGAIDDIRITARLEDIDGPFGVVGSAGPDDLRPGTLLPSEGSMSFDTADATREVADGTFVDTVAHEMLHALGFGTIWEAEFLGLLSGTTDLRFTGPNAIAAYEAIFVAIATADANSATGVPVETDFGPGTARGHWDEATFTNEVMTGIGGSADFMSGMTVAALEDMGYDTIFDVSIPAATMPQLSDFMLA